ncbi:MAG TPA: hypothetical protein PKY10_14470, partial [Lentisphaeria bacterium]|nr:hypothetical protein [Lentisphaeria bacterium]
APRAEVVNQWADDFRQVTGRYMSKVTAQDGDIHRLGLDVCATWAAIQGLQDALQALCRAARVLVICDEHHHAAVQAVWGEGADSAFADMLNRSHTRNRDLIARINAKITRFQLDYDRDVLPLTPRDNATERHIIAAFQAKALNALGGEAQAAAYWADAFGIDTEEVTAKIADTNAFAEFLRSKLIKRGGLGYQQPTDHTFPLLDDVIAAIQECRAIPMCAWLDGASQAEQKPEPFLQTLIAKGVVAVNIIPDRNWNFKDKDVQAKKIAALDEFVRLSRCYHLPINVGTEGNKPGQRLVDDFTAEAMRRHHQTFLQGAQVMVGHTLLLRYANVSYIDPTIDGRELTPEQRIAFFASVGALHAPPPNIRKKLADNAPDKAFAYLADSAAKHAWQ